MIDLKKLNFFSNNLIKKRNFFVNLLILSALSFVFFKNIDNIRYTTVSSDDGRSYIYDRFSSTLRQNK